MEKKLFVLWMILSISIYGQQSNDSAVVLELFTSQGCSSCPPADQLLDEIGQKYNDQNVYVLSYHVDYWNRLGWKDPYSAASYSDYQRAYALQFNSRSIYTPQLVVNGSEHFTGSDSYKANAALKKYRKSEVTHKITINEFKKNTSSIEIDYEVTGKGFTTITLALVVSERTIKVPRGENRNRTLKNTNIVASRVVAQHQIGKVLVPIPDWVSKEDALSVIAYAQDSSLKTTGAIKAKI